MRIKKFEWILILASVPYAITHIVLFSLLETYFPTDYSLFPLLSRPAFSLNFCVALVVASLLYLFLINYFGFSDIKEINE